MSLRFWANSKSVVGGVQFDDLAWFKNSVQGGVVILGIFSDAIAMSPSLYVKKIAETTLSIIKAIAIAAIGDNGSLRINIQKLGEATAAVTATILQSYLESGNKDGWPGSQLQGILDDLIRTLGTIEVWVSSGQARNTMGRRNCVKRVKDFQEQLSDVLERFELASLLRSYTVFPFIKKMIEDFAVTLDDGATKLQSSMNVADPSKAAQGSEIVEQGNPNPDSKQQKYLIEKETHDALRVKVRLILRIIEKEERNQHTSRDRLAPANQVSRGHTQYPQEKDSQASSPDELRGQLVPVADNMSGDHDNMEQGAVELLYEMLMARLSNVAIPSSKLLSPTHEQPQIPLPLPLPPNYTSTSSLSQSTSSDQLSLQKPLPSLELVDTSRSRKYNGYISQAREAEHAYTLSKPFNHVNQEIKSRSCASLPPGAMAPIVSTVSLLSILTSDTGRTDSGPSTPGSIRPERSLSVTPLPDIEEEVERGETPNTLGSPADGERKPIASPLSVGVQESMRFSRPSIPDQDKPTNSNQRVPLPVSIPTLDDTGKPSIGALDATRFTPSSIPVTTHPSSINILNGPPQALNTTRLIDALPGSPPFLPSTGPSTIKMPGGSPPLPPGAMPPKLSSWSSPAFGKEEMPIGHRLPGPVPTLNPISLPSTNADEKLPPTIQPNSSLSRQAGLTLNGSPLGTTNPGSEIKEEPLNYHLPPIPMPSPLTLAPLLVDSGSSHTPLLSLPPLPFVKRPEHLGPGENLWKMSPHMQRYVERLADRIWGGSEGGR